VPPAEAPSHAGPGRRSRAFQPSWGGALGLFIVLAGWAIGTRPLRDNSFLTHLATGRIILDTGSVPSHDPYSFTAAGEPWVVQSWLASLVYATAEQIGGLGAVRAVTGALAGLVAGLAWTLLRPASSLVLRAAAAALFVAVSGGFWAERPLMIGLVGLACFALAGEGRLDPRWLVPIAWVWVNAHGSFPLGLLFLGVAAVGRRLDGETWRVELRALRWALVGVLLGAVGPLGPRVLWFPVELLRRQDVLSQVVEWQAPTFTSTGQRLFLVQVLLAVVLLVRMPSFRAALILVTFAGAAFLGVRNVPVASLLLLPAAAPALRGFGTLRSDARDRIARPIAAVAVAGFLVVSLGAFKEDDLELRRYPVGALAYLEVNDVDTREVRLAAPDIVGNLVDYVYGPERRTFYDDRFDMFPEELAGTARALVSGTHVLRADLDEHAIDLVIVKRTAPSAQILTTDPGWRTLYIEDAWVLVCRRGADLSGSSDRC
jgi:hypothetical protein